MYSLTIYYLQFTILPSWILGNIVILSQFGLRNGVEIILLIPLAGNRGAGKHQIAADSRYLNVLEILGTLLPTAYIPETVILESQLHKALALIAGYPCVTILREIRHLDVGSIAQHVDSLVGCHPEGGIIGTTRGMIDGLCIVKIELFKGFMNI